LWAVVPNLRLSATVSRIRTLTEFKTDDAHLFKDVCLITPATHFDGGGSGSLVIAYVTKMREIDPSDKFINIGTDLIFRTPGRPQNPG